jgi:hypothetical protein
VPVPIATGAFTTTGGGSDIGRVRMLQLGDEDEADLSSPRSRAGAIYNSAR